MSREDVPFSIRLLATRAAVGPDIDVIACGGGFIHFRFRGYMYLTRKGYRCENYDSTIRHQAGLHGAGKMKRYEHVCPRCKQLIHGGA